MLIRVLVFSAALAASCVASPVTPKVFVALQSDNVPRSFGIAADFRGNYGGLNVYVVDGDRRSLKYISSLPSATILPSHVNPEDDSSILAVVEYEQHANDGVMAGFQWLKGLGATIHEAPVDYFLPIHPTSANDIERALISFPASQRETILESLPSNTVFIPVPSEEVTPAESLSEAAASALSAAGLSKSFSEEETIAPDFFISSLVDLVDETSILASARYLTGEDTRSGIVTRNSYSSDIYIAANYIKAQFEANGFNSSFFSYDTKLAPNVVNIFPGAVEPKKIVILGAHYDSRGPTVNSATNPAPGANDDGSGTSMLIEAAKSIGGMARLMGETSLFKYTIHVVAFSGEEQGLLGSRAYATYLKNNNADVVAMIQGDMIGYRKPGEVRQCAFPTRYHTTALTTSLKAVTKAYSPELTVGDSSACCSDHQSFYEKGYAATQFFERNGAIADDQYHKAGDVTNRTGYDVGQIAAIARAMIASIATLAIPV